MSNVMFQRLGILMMICGVGIAATPHIGLSDGHWGPWFVMGVICFMFGFVFYDIPKEDRYETSKLQPLPLAIHRQGEQCREEDEDPRIAQLESEAEALMDAAGWPKAEQ